MRERVGHNITLTFALQAIIAHRAGRRQRFFDIANVQQPSLLSVVRPHAGQKISLQFEPNRKLIGFGFAHSALRAIHLIHRAEQVLDMMTNFVRDYVGCGKITRRAESGLQLLKERQIDIELLISGAVERTHRGTGAATGRTNLIPEQHERRFAILSPELGEDLAPLIFGFRQHHGRKFFEFFLFGISRLGNLRAV